MVLLFTTSFRKSGKSQNPWPYLLLSVLISFTRRSTRICLGLERGLNQKLKTVVRKMFEVGGVLSKLVHLKRITDRSRVDNFCNFSAQQKKLAF